MQEKFIYLAILIGLFLMEADALIVIYRRIRNRFSIRRDLKKVAKVTNSVEKGRIYTYLEKLITAADMGQVFVSPEHLIYLSIFIFMFMSVGFMVFLQIKYSIFIAICFAAIPFVILNLRLSTKRAKGSREANILVQELSNNYKINACNMGEAIEATAISIESSATVKRIMITLAKNINNASSSDEIGSAVETFRYSFNTAWADILATNIYVSVYRGVIVEHSLKDLNRSIAKSKKIIEHSKRQGYEARMMIRYMMPICMVMTIFSAKFFFQMTVAEYFVYQFSNTAGLYWLITSVILYFAAFSADIFFSTRKLDI